MPKRTVTTGEKKEEHKEEEKELKSDEAEEEEVDEEGDQVEMNGTQRGTTDLRMLGLSRPYSGGDSNISRHCISSREPTTVIIEVSLAVALYVLHPCLCAPVLGTGFSGFRETLPPRVRNGPGLRDESSLV